MDLIGLYMFSTISGRKKGKAKHKKNVSIIKKNYQYYTTDVITITSPPLILLISNLFLAVHTTEYDDNDNDIHRTKYYY